MPKPCKTKKQPAPRKCKPSPPLPPVPNPSLRTHCSRAQLLKSFLALLQPNLRRWLLTPVPTARKRGPYERLFTPLIVLWYFVWGRLQDEWTLDKAVVDAHAGGADALSPKGKRLSRKLKSHATSALAQARARLPLATLLQALGHVAQTVRAWIPEPVWRGWRVILLDGSTLRLRPLGDIFRFFPPHGGRQTRRRYWCLLRVVVGFCLQTAVVCGSAMGATSVSEQALACQILLQAAPASLFVGDRNFGIFRMVQVASYAHAQVLVRRTRARALKLAGSGLLLPGLDLPVSWAPSRHDRLQPGLPAGPVAGRLIVVRIERPGGRPVELFLFTTLVDAQAYPAAELAALYGVRWHAELNLRYLKTQMALHTLEYKSAEMAQKEWVAGLIAYNLIRAVMVAAAAKNELSVYALSFRAAQVSLHMFMNRRLAHPEQTRHAWSEMVESIVARRLPTRRKARPVEPRAKRPFGQAVPTLYGSRAAARKKLVKTRAKS
jgi:putative transposase